MQAQTHTESLQSSTPCPQLEYDSEETTTTQARLDLIVFSFCSAALTGNYPSNTPTHPPNLSPLVHPHRSLMMCRLHRAGLSNDIITISKNLLLPYELTSCGMFHGPGHCSPQTTSPPYIFLSKWLTVTVYYTSQSTSCSVLFQLVKRHQCCSRLSSEGTLPLVSISNERLVFADVSYMTDMEQRHREHGAESHAGLSARTCNKPESHTLENTILFFSFVAKKKLGVYTTREKDLSDPRLRFSHLNKSQHKHTDLSNRRFLLQH